MLKGLLSVGGEDDVLVVFFCIYILAFSIDIHNQISSRVNVTAQCCLFGVLKSFSNLGGKHSVKINLNGKKGKNVRYTINF